MLEEKPKTVAPVVEDHHEDIDNVIDPIKDMLNPTDSEASSVEEKPKESTVTALTSDEVQRLIRENDSKWEDKFNELDQERNILRGQLYEIRESRNAAPPREEEPKEFTIDETKLATEMEQNAPRALVGVMRDMIQHEFGKLRGELTKDVDGKLTATQIEQRRTAAYSRDVQSVNEEYGDYLKDKDFVKEADKEIETIITGRGGKSLRDYSPGDLQSAASRVALRWARAGKLSLTKNEPAEGNSPPLGNGSSLREVIRRVPQSDSLGNGNGRRAAGPPKTIDELFPDERSRRIAKAYNKKLGISEEAYIRNYLKGKESDDFVG